MADHLKTFLERTRCSDRPLPAYVERELRAYLECGMLPFGLALNLNPHFHVLMPDGVFVEGLGGAPVFVPAPSLTDDAVRRIAETTAHRVVNFLQCRGLLEEDAAGGSSILKKAFRAGRCASPLAYRLTWARLLARVFRIDVTVCPQGRGRMKIIAALDYLLDCE